VFQQEVLSGLRAAVEQQSLDTVSVQDELNMQAQRLDRTDTLLVETETVYYYIMVFMMFEPFLICPVS